MLLENDNFLLLLTTGDFKFALYQGASFQNYSKQNKPDEKEYMCVHSSLYKFPSGHV